MHLRQGVKSCAGNVFSADDVIYTLARGKSVSGAAPINWFLGSVGSIAGFDRSVFTGGSKDLGDAVTKIDDHTVQIRQSSDNALLLTVLTIYSMAPFDSVEMKKHATEADPWSHIYANTVNSPGFGPYCLETWVKDDEFVLRANPNYYRGKPAIDRVVIKRVPQSANRALTLRSGQAQLTQRLTVREFENLSKAARRARRGHLRQRDAGAEPELEDAAVRQSQDAPGDRGGHAVPADRFDRLCRPGAQMGCACTPRS